MNVKVYRRIILMLLVGALGMISSAAQDLLQVNPQATYTAYQCRFDRVTNSVMIRGVLTGADGLPVPRDAYSVAVNSVNDGVPVNPALFSTDSVPVRPPLQMILVLDTTDTVPIEQLVNAVSRSLVPQLQVQDRIALITFAEAISPRTQFYTDKNRLLNEHMIDLNPGEGDNRLYDAIFEAVSEFPLNDDSRQVVLAITDSNRRDIEQISLGEIINRADREAIQVYTVGINSGADQPDVAELEQLAAATGGYVWVWDSTFISRAGIEEGVTEALDEFIVTLNTEIVTSVGLEGLTPDANSFLTFDVNITTQNDATLTDRVACQIEELFHEISFFDTIQDGTISGPFDIGVNVESDLGIEDLAVRFLVNDEIMDTPPDQLVYRFNSPAVEPGTYTITAELVSRRTGELLDTTDRAVELFVQANVVAEQPAVSPNIETNVNEGRFEVTTDAPFALPPVEFTIAEKSNPDATMPLLDEGVPFVEGNAVAVVPNISERVETLFPDSDEEVFIVTAIVRSVNPQDPEAVARNEFEVRIPRIVAPPPEVVRGPRFSLNERLRYWSIFIVLLILNIMVFRSVARARVRYRIAHPDNIDLSPTLMAITVRREGIKQMHTLTNKTIKIGRGSDNDINLGDDPNISRNHAVVMWRNGGWVYSNGKRRALARINGRRRIGYCWHRLHPIAEIEIGNALLIFHSNAQTDVTDLIKTNL